MPLLPLLRRLYEAGSVLTVLPIQDLFGWPERINVPATTTDENWSFRLPVPIHRLDEEPSLRRRMAELREIIAATGRAPQRP